MIMLALHVESGYADFWTINKQRKTHTEHTQHISTFQAARIVAETTCRCQIRAI